MAKSKTGVVAETKQIGKFGAVGIINTVLDFAVFNLLIIYAGFPRIPANIVSTTIAMTFSFLANKNFVFRDRSEFKIKQAAMFLVITAFGLYVIQNLVLWLLTEEWTGPLNLGYDLVELLGLDTIFSKEFVINNGAKVVATGFSMVWNYLTYKKIVFKK